MGIVDEKYNPLLNDLVESRDATDSSAVRRMLSVAYTHAELSKMAFQRAAALQGSDVDYLDYDPTRTNDEVDEVETPVESEVSELPEPQVPFFAGGVVS